MPDEKILLWGLPEDQPIKMVLEYLRCKNYPVIFLNHADIDETIIEIDFNSMKGVLKAPGIMLKLEEIKSFYFRPYDFRYYPNFQNIKQDVLSLAPFWEIENLLWKYAELSDQLLINPPVNSATNQSKPFQLQLIRKAGFVTPQTLITSNPDEVLNFLGKHKKIVYKSISAARSIVKIFDKDDLQRLQEIKNLPVQFQQYIPGNDYRVHIVGDDFFVAKITCSDDDYRYGKAVVEDSNLPTDIIERCFTLGFNLGLPVCGIDLRVTPDGECFCFEVNPSPGYSYYEAMTGQPISNAIGELLVKQLSGKSLHKKSESLFEATVQ